MSENSVGSSGFFLQVEGIYIDFDETYNPVVKFPTIWIMLALVISKGWRIHEIDVDNAFLNGDLKEEVYMTQ